MQSRRDLVQAYQFSAGRLVAALITGETGRGESPLRQSGLGLAFGVALGVLACAGLGVYGLLRPAPSTAWHTPGTVVVQQETGTRFVYLGGELHPVANYASALLAAASVPGSSAAAVQYVPGSELARVPQGPEIGIVGAPDTLPEPAALLPPQWAMCTDPATPGGTVLDLAPRGAIEIPPDDRVLVTSAAGEYVVWDNAKFPARSKGALVALGLGNADPVDVSAAWLDELPSGPQLTAAPIPQDGRPGARVAGRDHAIGDLFSTVAGGIRQYYVLLADGLAPISPTEFALRAAVPGGPAPVPVTPADVAAAPASANRWMLTAMPDIMAGSVFQPGGWAFCVLSSSTGAGGHADLAIMAPGPVSQVRLSGGAGLLVPPGAGLLARAPASGTAVGGLAKTQPEYLITGGNKKFPLAGSDVAAALGYGAVTAVDLPPLVLGLIPTGPALSVPAAEKVVPWLAG